MKRYIVVDEHECAFAVADTLEAARTEAYAVIKEISNPIGAVMYICEVVQKLKTDLVTETLEWDKPQKHCWYPDY